MTTNARAESVRIVPTASPELVAGFQRCVELVARERRYLALVEGPPLEMSAAFVSAVLGGGGVHLVAVDEAGEVVGWCDIMRDPRAGFEHRGQLGMGLLPAWRGQRLGRRLADAAIAAARERGMERLELEVFASNARAIALYERIGFVREGVKRRARKLDGVYDDDVFMALSLTPQAQGAPDAGGDGAAVAPSRVAGELATFLEYLDRVHARTRRVVVVVPPADLEWAPAPGRFTFGDLVRHLAGIERGMYAETVYGRQSRYPGHGRELADGFEAVLAYYDRSHAEARSLFAGLSDADLGVRCQTPAGAPITIRKWLRLMLEHEAHHRGQIYLMLGLRGVPVPQLYGVTSEEVRARSAGG